MPKFVLAKRFVFGHWDVAAGGLSAPEHISGAAGCELEEQLGVVDAN